MGGVGIPVWMRLGFPPVQNRWEIHDNVVKGKVFQCMFQCAQVLLFTIIIILTVTDQTVISLRQNGCFFVAFFFLANLI